ncbi:MAG: D-alanyl-D-alanine carboxypeptidase [Gammaproteobacteria bacterium]|nr:D-alanyl-D-alanine carboxypeptidase [Gammaproteobacteria bacterium]
MANINDVNEPYSVAFSNLPKAPSTEAKSYILMDFNSGAILADFDAHKIVEPASLTKIMTMYIIDKELASSRIKLTDSVKVSKKAWQMDGSRMFIEVNREVTVSDLIHGIIIQSGNDASVAMAEHVAGSEEAFVDLMNKAAQDLKMTNTHFMNATGMPNKDHYTTAFDLALLSRAIIRDFPESYALYSQQEFTYNNIKQSNRNSLLSLPHISADGIKTGYTENAGYCLAASAIKDGMRLISVVLGADSTKQRAKETASLLQYGFRFYDTIKLYASNSAIGQKRAWLGDKQKVNVGLAKDLYITIPKGKYKSLSAKVETQKYLIAPQNRYTEIGKITIELDKEVLAQKPLVVLNELPKGRLWQRIKDRVQLSVDKFLGQEQELELTKMG